MERQITKLLLTLISIISINLIVAEALPNANATFYNPVVDYYSPDPYVTKYNGSYWLVLSDNDVLTVHNSSKLYDYRNATTSVAYQVGPGFDRGSVWAPEIHNIKGDWYIYFAMSGNGSSHRMYVIKAENSSNPLGKWSSPVRMYLDAVNDAWAIDATVLQYGNGKNYLIWSAWPREDPVYPSNGSIYIAELETPFKIKGERILLREPHEAWEAGDVDGVKIALVNEGPQVLQHDNRTFVFFSANGAWLPDYCLGMMGIDNLKDPLVPSNWWNKIDGPVFWRNDEQSVYTTGHCSLTTSPDDTETWLVYHATDRILPPGELQTIRKTRAQKISWDSNGNPVFPRPVGLSTPIPVPSGQKL
ncbi:unnamed protein product [Allacma fusca]|uniref:Uncharacterized protein n=1 Tax=Allacma fusca TaxID=39272 RepID=A0A8J2JDA7_9HEXA|nr:unnamed protein product [Allacma fusca]